MTQLVAGAATGWMRHLAGVLSAARVLMASPYEVALSGAPAHRLDQSVSSQPNGGGTPTDWAMRVVPGHF